MSYFMGELSQQGVAEFKKQKQKRTLRDKILGTTNSGRAFRIGSAVSLAGLGGLAFKKKAFLGQLKKQPINTLRDKFTRIPDPEVINLEWKTNKQVIKNPNPEMKNGKGQPQEFINRTVPYGEGDVKNRFKVSNGRSFLGSGKTVRWGNVAKTGAIAGTAVAIPTSAAYLAGNKDDREKVNSRVRRGSKVVGNGLKTAKSWINTLHRVSK